MDIAATSSSPEVVTLSLELLATEVARCPVEGLSSQDVVGLLATVRGVQRALDGLVVRLGLRADALAEGGTGAGAREVLGRGVRAATARAEAARVKTADQWPRVGHALAEGLMSGDHADCLARRLGPLTSEQQRRVNVDTLVDQAYRLPADTFDTVVKGAADRARQDDGIAEAQAQRAASEFRHGLDANSGMAWFRGRLDPERYESLVAALEAHMNTVASQEPGPVSKNANLAARALHELVTRAQVGGRPAPSAGFVIDQRTLSAGAHHGTVCESVDGRPLAVASVGRMLCDSVLRRVVLDERGVPIDVGRRYRTATDAQWAAMKAVYCGCAWDGCDRPISWCQLHHIHYWERGGATDLCNLVPLCNRHHHLVHEGRWTLRLLPDRRLEIYRPDGEFHSVTPPPTRRVVQHE